MVLEFMDKKRWLALALIIIVITVLRTMVQPFIPSDGPSPFPPSAFVLSGLLPAAFVAYGFIMLGLLALVFIMVQGGLPGTKLVKGLTFSLSFGFLWFVYLLEPLPHGSWQLPAALYYPAVDGTTLALFGLLMGMFVATDSDRPVTLRARPGLLALAVIALAFVAGRLLAYNVFHIYAAFAARTSDTMLWAVATGLWIGVMYYLLRPGIAAKGPLARAAFFGVVIFGVNIFLNDLFMPLPFAMETWGLGIFSYADMVVRTAMDVIFVAAGAYVYERALPIAAGKPQASLQGAE